MAGTAGIAFLVLVLRSGGTAINVEQAVESYRSHSGNGPAPQSGLPAPGVYLYDTVGAENLSIPGLSRTYPTRTPMIYSRSACGVELRWDALQEHIEAFTLCPGPGNSIFMSSSRTTEQFAGVGTTEYVDCPANAYLVPPHAVTNEVWSAPCRSQGDTIRLVGRVMGFGSVRVEGQQVPATHTRVTIEYSGSQTGSSPADYWFATRDFLLLKEIEYADISQGSSPLGGVTYHEQVRLTLASASPRR